MSHRIQQINELLKKELAVLVSREIPIENSLITITYVNTSPDLRYAKVGVSVLPDNTFGSALKKLRAHSKPFSQELKKKLNLKFIPKFSWVADDQEKHAAKIDELINGLHK